MCVCVCAVMSQSVNASGKLEKYVHKGVCERERERETGSIILLCHTCLSPLLVGMLSVSSVA